MKRLFFLALVLLAPAVLTAQPKKSRVAANRAKAQSAQTVSRASLMYPTAVAVPDEVPWRRDIYRELDLTDDQNAALYYPTEPRGNEMNLFTLLFRLLNTGKIPAYKYDINTGLENFTQDNRMHFKDMLDSYEIPYEVQGNSIQVLDYDIPSAEVLSYYVKESSYYDEETATYHTRVVAFCPVLHRSDDFSMDERKYPLFWVKIEDVEPYLSQRMIMVSNVNNAARMSMADFFYMNRYKGKIYMTTNMQGRSLRQMYPSDSLMTREQKRIEQEMSDFEKHIWAAPVDSAALAEKDSVEAAAAASKKSKKRAASSASASTSRSARRATKAKSKDQSSSSSSSKAASAPRVSVRRQRH